MHRRFLVGLGLASGIGAIVSPDGTGRLPAMGWNSWNQYQCNINEDTFITIGQRLKSLGLQALGYEYVNIDDCWSDKAKRRDPSTQEILPDLNKFPKGISDTAQRIHDLGLKLGIYSDAGTSTCANYAGSIKFEAIDAATFAKWGIDYLKYDNCNVPSDMGDQYNYDVSSGSSNAPAGYDWSTSNTAKRFGTMRDALLKQNRTINFSLCVWGNAHVERWGNSTGHSWRMFGDIEANWGSVARIINQAAFFWSTTNFWSHNDWDMLEVGNGGMTIEENRSHFALWAALKSPLIIGTPLDTIQPSILSILSNKELIAFNQDTVHGESARPFNWDGKSDTAHPAGYWVGDSVKGRHVFMLNSQSSRTKMSFKFTDIGLDANTEYLVHDMWSGKDVGRITGSVSLDVATHDTVALTITKA